jgi:integrase
MEIKTWGAAMDYTFSTRHTWRHGNGKKTAMINCNHFTRLRGSSFPITKINQPNVTQVSIELEDEGKSDATINRVVSAVSTVLNHCAFDGLIGTPPKFRRRKESEGRVLYYTKEEVDRLAYLSTDVFMREDLRDIITFAAFTGMRQGEILKLRCKDVDWISNRVLVGGEEVVKTKAGNFRAIPIHERIAPILQARCSQSRSHVRLFGDEWRDKDQLLRAFRKVNKLIPKDENYVFHTLRHSFATWHAEAGTPIRTLMALMGHKRIETTLRYAKATDSALTEAMAAI